MMNVAQELAEHEDVARKSKVFARLIKQYQDSLSAIEKVRNLSTCADF